MILSALVFSTMLSMGASVPVQVETASEVKAPIIMIEDAGDEIGFVEKYFQFMPDPLMDQAPLEPEIQENFWLLAIVSGVLPFGNVWAPMLFLDGVELHEDFMMEAIIGAIIRSPFMILFYWGYIYMNMVNGIHSMDRNIKKSRGKSRAKWSKTDKLPQIENAAVLF